MDGRRMIDTYAMTRAERLRALSQMMRGLLTDYPLKMLLRCSVAAEAIGAGR